MESRIWHQHYDPGVPVTIDYPPYPMDHFLQESAERYPDNTAIIFGGVAPWFGELHRRISYRELNDLVDRFAAGLQSLGLKKGGRVAVYMANCPQFVIAYYGVLRAGGIVVPTNPLYAPREVARQLNDSGAEVAVVLSMLYPKVKEVQAETPVRHVVVSNVKEYFPPVLKLLFTLAKEKQGGHRVDISDQVNATWMQDFLRSASRSPEPVEVTPDDTAVLMYTGGTTGAPKGAELTHKNIVANAMQSSAWLTGDGDRQEVMLTSLPLTHCYSMTVSMNLSIVRAYPQVIIPDPRDFDHLLNATSKHKATLFPGVPALYTVINHNPQVKAGKYDLTSIRACLSGAAGLPEKVQQEFQQLTGGKLVEGYGLSEASPVTHANPINSGGRIGTIGVPVPDTEVKIVDDETEEEEVGPNEAGVLCIHGPQVMKGYWGMPAESANVLRTHADGKVWLHTGDIAERTEDGYFRIVDRKKDMILTQGGLNVYPRDIEERLYEHPKVMEAAVIGVPVGSTSQRAKAFIVAKEGETLTKEEIVDWCREGLAQYKVPRYVEFRDALPKSMVGKVLRRVLAEEEEKKKTRKREAKLETEPA